MPAVNSYRDLEVWQRAVGLVEACYALTASLPYREQFILGTQIRRAAVSIPANIAEGQQRPRRAYLNHLTIALGSLAELETHLEVARRLSLFKDSALADTNRLTQSVGQFLHALVRSLQRS